MHVLKYFSLCILIFSFTFFLANAESSQCEYTQEIEQCLKANNNNTARTIDGFICLTDTNTDNIIYQIVLDKEFKKIDEEAELYLEQLELQKDQYFSPQSKLTYIHAIDEIEKKFGTYGEYWQAYNNACGINIVAQVLDCNGGKTSNSQASEFLKGGDGVCMKIAEESLVNYKQVAFDTLALNKIEYQKDTLKRFIAQGRSKYEKLVDTMMINLGYIDRILHKWTGKIKNTH